MRRANDRRRDWPRFQKEAFEANMRMVDRVKELATKKGCTPGQLALAWVHAQGPDVFPIPGTKRIKYLEVGQSGLPDPCSAARPLNNRTFQFCKVGAMLPNLVAGVVHLRVLVSCAGECSSLLHQAGQRGAKVPGGCILKG